MSYTDHILFLSYDGCGVVSRLVSRAVGRSLDRRLLRAAAWITIINRATCQRSALIFCFSRTSTYINWLTNQRVSEWQTAKGLVYTSTQSCHTKDNSTSTASPHNNKQLVFSLLSSTAQTPTKRLYVQTSNTFLQSLHGKPMTRSQTKVTKTVLT